MIINNHNEYHEMAHSHNCLAQNDIFKFLGRQQKKGHRKTNKYNNINQKIIKII